MTFQKHIDAAYNAAIAEYSNMVDPFQPGFIREYQISKNMGHTLILGKKGKDAIDGKGNQVEYKTFSLGGWGEMNAQLDIGFEHLLQDTEYWIFAEFDSPFSISRLWRVEMSKISEQCRQAFQTTKKTNGHIMIHFRISWIETNGRAIEVSSDSGESVFISELRKAQEIAVTDFGVGDITLKGRIREILIAEKLGHEIIVGSKDADARDKSGAVFEYLTSKSGKFQVTHLTEENMYRITRNDAIICANFNSPIEIDSIWRVNVADYMARMEGRRPWPENKQNNFTIPIRWVESVGKQLH